MDGWMDKEVMVNVHNEITLSHKKWHTEEILWLMAAWMKHGGIILTERCKTNQKKIKYYMISLICWILNKQKQQKTYRKTRLVSIRSRALRLKKIEKKSYQETKTSRYCTRCRCNVKNDEYS